MKKRFSILIVGTVIIGLTLSLFGMALVFQTASAKKDQSWHSQVPKPVHATNIKVVKKVLLPSAVREIKGKPAFPGKNKTKEGAATGVLGESATGNKYAIVIGICDYPGTDYDLCESDGDSLHMYKALTTLYGYDPANIYLFKDMGKQSGFGETHYGEPTRNAIYGAIMDIKNKVATDSASGLKDEVTFFFSGHGTSGIVDDSDAERIDEAIFVHGNKGTDTNDNVSYIWDGELRGWFDGFATTRIAFVFDSCLAGGMNDVAGEGRVISMATDETHSAYVYSPAGEDVDGDGIYDGEGVFSRLFVNKGMLQGLADVYDHDSDATTQDVVVEEEFDYAKKNIPGYLKRRQKPVISDKFDKDLLL